MTDKDNPGNFLNQMVTEMADNFADIKRERKLKLNLLEQQITHHKVHIAYTGLDFLWKLGLLYLAGKYLHVL